MVARRLGRAFGEGHLSSRGILRQILAGLGIGRSSPSPASTETPPTDIRTERVTVRERIHVRDPRTGETHVYGSLEDVPAEFREKVEAARRAAGQSGTHTKITVTDASGTTRTYQSVEEMPDDTRQLYERAQREVK